MRRENKNQIKQWYLCQSRFKNRVKLNLLRNGKIYDIAPRSGLTKISREILGLKPYKSIKIKLFAIMWRLIFATFLISFFVFGINPASLINKTIMAASGGAGNIELYAGQCTTDTDQEKFNAGWWGAGRAAGKPSIASLGDMVLFSDENSAFYNGGNFNLECGNFNNNDDENNSRADQEKSKELQVYPNKAPSSVSSLPEQADANISSSSASSSPTFDENTEPDEKTSSSPEAAQNATSFFSDSDSEDGEKNSSSVEIIELPKIEDEPVIVDSENGSLISAVSASFKKVFAYGKKIAEARFGSRKAFAGENKNFEDYGELRGAKIRLSYAVGKKEDIADGESKPLFTIWYSTDTSDIDGSGELWQELDTVYSDDASNAINGGYPEYSLNIQSWDELRGLKIKFEGNIPGKNGFLTYLDSVWVEADYEKGGAEAPKEEKISESKLKKWDKMMDLISEKKDFKMDEKFDFRFNYKKNMKSIGDLFSIADYWKNVNLKAEVIDRNGNLLNFPLNIYFEDDGNFTVKSPELPREFKPGIYNVRFNIEDNSGFMPEIIVITKDFSWGVLALNSNKSIYLPNETAKLDMGVLDDLGHTLCNVDLSLQITAPDGGVATLSTENGLIKKNPDCGYDNFVSEPDYSANYGLGGVGIYNIVLTATTANGDRTITDSFEVRGSVPFDIERIGPTRINPKFPYEMKMKIEANEDYGGDIVETVPESFKFVSRIAYRVSQYGKEEMRDMRYEMRDNNGEQQLIFQNIELKAGDKLELNYTFDAPDISPEFFLLGPLTLKGSKSPIGLLEPLRSEPLQFQETRKWQIASDAVGMRAKTVQFIGGMYSAIGAQATAQFSNTDQSFGQFNFSLPENSVSIKNAYIMVEAMFKAYTGNDVTYTGYTLAFDSCSGTNCGANAWAGTSTLSYADTNNIAYNEFEANQVRLLLDVTNEAQLSAYQGGGGDMQAQIGYRFNRTTAAGSISYAKAVLVITYAYDKNSSPTIANTVIYPLEIQGGSGTKAGVTANNCTKNTNCPLFDYNMDIPEYNTASGSSQLSQWFQIRETNDLGTTNDIGMTVNIEGTDTDSARYLHEAANSDNGNIPFGFFTNVSGYSENASQTLEYVATTTAGAPNHYLIGGEVIETYTASSSATTKTRTVSFPIGVVNTGATAASTTASTNVYFPENGTATGTVKIKKAWLRINSNMRSTGSNIISVASKVGSLATSSNIDYVFDVGATINNPSYYIFHVISSSTYTELENANATASKEVTVLTKNSLNTNGGVSAELMITYTYSDESLGYLSSLSIFGGQSTTTPSQGASTTAGRLVYPENSGKTMLGAMLFSSHLISGSDGSVTAGTGLLDANIGTSAYPGCTNAFRSGINGYNMFAEFNKGIPVSQLGTTDNQQLYTCISENGGGDANNVSKSNAYLTYTYSWVNTAPTSTIFSIINRKDGTGIVDVSIKANDADQNDLKGRIEYEAGTSCAFATSTKLSLDETDANATSTYGDAIINNNLAYQVGSSTVAEMGSSTGWIITSSGENMANFDWLSKNNLNSATGTYCVRFIANDFVQDQVAAATGTITIDNLAPQNLGALSATNTRATSTYLLFGSPVSEDNFTEYKIFYKEFDGAPVTEFDTAISSSSDPNLGVKNFNNATSTKVTLEPGVSYSFNIWAYDSFGNKASSTQIDFTANSYPTGVLNSAAQKINGSGSVDLSFVADDPNSGDNLMAKIEYVQGSACDFTSPYKATIDSTQSNIEATYGVPKVDNNQDFQIGTSTGWITIAPGANTLNVDWLSKTDVPDASSTLYCLRLTVNDQKDDQNIIATTTVTVDNTDPTSPGNLTNNAVTMTSVTLNLGSSSMDTAFDQYKIFYKQGISGVTEADTEFSSSTSPGDPSLRLQNYDGKSTTTVSGLLANTFYVFNIWAYDLNGNKASSTEVVAKTNASVTNDLLTFTNPQSGNIAVANGTNEWNFRAVVTEQSGWHILASTTLRLADVISSTSPFTDLVFKWDETTNNFSEIGTDTNNAASLSPNSTSTCAVNTCTLDFKIIFNHQFAAPSTNYNAELTSSNDSSVADNDIYNNIYQVKRIKIQQKHYRWRNDNGGN